MNNVKIEKLTDFNTQLRIKGFNVYEVENDARYVRSYHKREYFKICIDTGHNVVHFANGSFEVNGTVLFITSPQTPYVWEANKPTNDGFAGIFSEKFLQTLGIDTQMIKGLDHSAVMYELTAQQKDLFGLVFKNLLQNQQDIDPQRMDSIRSGIRFLLEETQNMVSAQSLTPAMDRDQRITMVFLDFLERQFPLKTENDVLEFRTTQQYAEVMGVSTDVLQQAVAKITGKTVDTTLFDRSMTEAYSMLSVQHTAPVDIAQKLGFATLKEFTDAYDHWKTKEKSAPLNKTDE